LGRSVVRPVEEPRAKRTLSGLVVAGIALVLLFAVLGVISAGALVADKMSSSAKATATPHSIARSNLVPRAQSQATSIVRAAQTAGHHIVATATSKGNKQAKVLLANAKKQANAQAVTVPTAQSVSPGTSVGTSTGTGTTSSSGQAAGSTSAGQSSGSSAINLRSLPASWLVVAYNASFGSGPGSVGGITVTNRSGKRFSGVARVAYTRGGYVSATFSGLAPGQTVVLPLNGAAYQGGGYRILILHPH
jgi:hypothetical protein